MKIDKWLNPVLQQDIRNLFEPQYNRPLTELEVYEIAENLSGVIEEILKLRWKESYGQLL